MRRFIDLSFGTLLFLSIFVVMKTKHIIALSITAATLMGTGAYFAPLFLTKNEKEAIVYIYPDMDKEELADTLKSRLGVKFGGRTATMLRLLDADMTKRAGAYRIEENMSPLHAARRLQRGSQTGVRFTFSYARTKEQFAERVSHRLLMSKDSLLNRLNDPTFCRKYGKTPETISSIFFPDSYEFYWTVSPDDFADRMYVFYNAFWNEERKAKAAALGLSPDEVTTLASIVEEEIAKRDEAGKVARLYINRLRKGILLQADPTVKFAIGDFSLRRIYGSMLKTDSPYNTYMYKGLPPGPIRFAGKRTIDAVLDAPEHPYIYMCAKEDFSGYHNFTASYAEHKANARRYQRELNRRGIKKNS